MNLLAQSLGGFASEVFGICKAVISAPIRREIQTLLGDLQISTYADGRPGRGTFGYFAPRFGRQVSGYLTIDAERQRLHPAIGAIPALTSRELSILYLAHAEIMNVNTACLEHVEAIKVGLADSANPYASTRSFAYLSPPLGESIVDPSLLQRLGVAFTKTSAFQLLANTPAPTIDQFPLDRVKRAVADLDRLLMRPGVGGKADELTGIVLQSPKDFAPRIGLAFHAALASVRGQLRIVDQLIFQSLWHDRLRTIDANTLIACDGPSSNIAENSTNVSVIPTDRFGLTKPGDVVFFRHPTIPALRAGLAEIVSTRFEMSRTTGTVEYFGLHHVNEDLTPYPLHLHFAK